ncbi:unnamed protein product [Hydatigera taeniaeformis]|uniref:Uncharacterized protein n=1 Tax=Hydatigena taeniaeformis TaxID=6205 RepID=A0A0R3WXU6_HYDTA|nr:unnamed protein product [Hydatigera taeniaeformis]
MLPAMREKRGLAKAALSDWSRDSTIEPNLQDFDGDRNETQATDFHLSQNRNLCVWVRYHLCGNGGHANLDTCGSKGVEQVPVLMIPC